MKSEIESRLNTDAYRILGIIYSFTVGPLLYYSFRYIKLMNSRMDLTLLLLTIQTVGVVVLFVIVLRQATKKMRFYLCTKDDKLFVSPVIRAEAYSYPLYCYIFLLIAWLFASNISIYLPLYFLGTGSFNDLVIINMLSLSAGIISGPLAFVMAEMSSTKFLKLEGIHKIPEPEKSFQLSISAKIVLVCVCIIISIFLNFLAATFMQDIYHLSHGQALTNILILGTESFLITIVLAAFFARAVSGQLTNAVNAFRDIASGNGDLTIRLNVISNDEVGKLSRFFNVFVGNLQEMIGRIRQSSTTVTESSSELSSSATNIAASTEEISMQMETVAAATEQATANVNSISSAAEEMSSSANGVAGAIEEMSASLKEVAASCSKEALIAKDGSTKAAKSKEIMVILDNSAKSIGKITETINNIAAQTNLLALNATIQAASAGESGKGFAVVAGEVKELAKKSAQATKDIEDEISAMQENAHSAVNFIEAIVNIIEEIDSISQTIVSAVEQQSVTINEISQNVAGLNSVTGEVARNVTESAKGLQDISATVAGVSTAVSDSSNNVQQVKLNSVTLSQLSDDLKKLIGQFKA